MIKSRFTDAMMTTLLLLYASSSAMGQETNSFRGASESPASVEGAASTVRRELALKTNLFGNVYSWDAQLWQTNKMWLEAQYARLGYRVELLYRSEFGIFLLGLRFYSAPAADYAAGEKGRLRAIALADLPQETLSKLGPKRVLSRDEFLANWVTNQYNVERIAFDKDKWRKAATAGAADRDWTRYRLFKDVVANTKLEGLSTEELERLLGAPEERGPGEVRYNMGPELRLISLDSSMLVFEIADGKVRSWRIIRR